MTCLEGQALGKRTWEDISPEHQSFIYKQLAGYTAELCRCQTFDKIGALRRTVSGDGVATYEVLARPLNINHALTVVDGLKLDDIMPVNKVRTEICLMSSANS